MRRFLAPWFALVLLLVACGDDGGGGGSAAAFCALLEEEALPTGGEEPDLDTLRELAETAPSEIRDDLDTLLDAFAELEDLDEDDPESFGAAFEIFLDPSVAAAGANLEEFAVDECGLDPDDLDGGSDFGDDFDDLDFGDDFDDFDPDEVDPTELSIDGIKAHFAANHEGEAFVDAVFGYGIFGDSQIELNGDFDGDDDALAACEAVADYAIPINPDVVIEVTDGDEELLASNESGSCELV